MRGLLFVVLGVVWVSGCLSPAEVAQDPTGPDGICTMEGWPSVIVEVRDQDGRPAARGATLLIRDGAFVDSAGPASSMDELRLGAGNRRAGTYEVRVSKPGYREAVIRDVRVPGGPCGAVGPVTVEARVELLPGAPAVRSVVVYPPSMGLGLPGIEVEMRAYVDAAPGVDTAVVWSSSDTTVATVTPAGLLTSQCRAQTATAVIAASATADPSRRGYGSVTVSPPPEDTRGISPASARERAEACLAQLRAGQ